MPIKAIARRIHLATFRNETWNPGRYHRVEPASDLNSIDLLNGNFWNLRDVVVLANSIQSFRSGKHGRSTLANEAGILLSFKHGRGFLDPTI
jgi:hypothetical protein